MGGENEIEMGNQPAYFGIQIGSLPVTLANAVTLVLALVILILKYRYRK